MPIKQTEPIKMERDGSITFNIADTDANADSIRSARKLRSRDPKKLAELEKEKEAKTAMEE